MIISSSTLKSLATQHFVIIKSNTPPTRKLKNYCHQNNITLLYSTKTKGFGANNNDIFRYAKRHLSMKTGDFFLVLNPDVEIHLSDINRLIHDAIKQSSNITAINLYKDTKFTIYDNSIRYYPKFLTPLKSLIGIKRNDFYDKTRIKQPISIDWAAGSFLLFTVDCYQVLNGFDERYFMYFEDADICTRANNENFNVQYFPHIKAVHYAAHNNRKLFSKHLIWYILSAIRYQLNYK